jgi:HPt (histidine-containing phosphotransfer) domain-containing protein
VSLSPNPVLDEEALQRLRDLDPSGQSRLLGRVMLAFETSVERLWPQLRDAKAHDDMQAVRHVVHTLKSSSASIGALRLSRLCAEIETAIRQEVSDGVHALLDDVDHELAVVLQAVQPMRDMPG